MYEPPKVTKYEIDSSTFHELINLLQIITAQCDLWEDGVASPKEHVKAIRSAAFKMSDRLRKHRQKSA